jgi:hypothetical protein
MATKKQSLEHLQRVPLFSGCTAKDLEKVLKAGDEITAAAGQVIIDQGQTGREAFVILAGSATVRRNGKKVATLGAGAIVGELALFDHGPRTATVVCDTECQLLVIAQREFLGVLAEVPSLNRRMLEFLAGKIREFDRQSFG